MHITHEIICHMTHVTTLVYDNLFMTFFTRPFFLYVGLLRTWGGVTWGIQINVLVDYTAHTGAV